MPPGADPMGPFCPAGDPRGFATKFYTSQGNWDLVRLGALPLLLSNVSAWSVSLVHAVSLTGLDALLAQVGNNFPVSRCSP